MGRKRREVSTEERRLWQAQLRDVAPMKRPAPPATAGAARPVGPPVAAEPGPPAPPRVRPAYVAAPFSLGTTAQTAAPAHDIAPPLRDRLVAAPLRMDHKTRARMRAGKLAPEARIDLHGMTLDAAFVALTSFVLGSAASGRRLVLVITGKGQRRGDHGPIPSRDGALRHAAPDWLRGPAMGHAVLQIEPAHRRHGGDGALYVYLKRRG